MLILKALYIVILEFQASHIADTIFKITCTNLNLSTDLFLELRLIGILHVYRNPSFKYICNIIVIL